MYGRIQEDMYIIEPASLFANDFIVSKYLTWIAVFESNIFDRLAKSLATSTSPLALMILLSALRWATAAETSSL